MAVRREPVRQPAQFLQQRGDAVIGCLMNLDPVNAIPSRFFMSYRVVPSMTVAIRRFEGSIDVYTPFQFSGVPAAYSSGVGSKRLKPRPKGIPAKIRCCLDGLPEAHRPFDATAVATSVFARSLKSVRPPQPASNGRSADGSRVEMSCTFPESRWK